MHPVTIDGYTQPGASEATAAPFLGGSASLLVTDDEA